MEINIFLSRDFRCVPIIELVKVFKEITLVKTLVPYAMVF